MRGVLFTWLWILRVVCSSFTASVSVAPKTGEEENMEAWEAWQAMDALLQEEGETKCSAALVTEARSPLPAIRQTVGGGGAASSGWSVFEVVTNCSSSDDNTTTAASVHLANMLREVRQVRRRSWCLTVVMLVTASCPLLLEPLAEAFLMARLLSEDTKLLVVTRTAPTLLAALLSRHWVFAMANTLVINLRNATTEEERVAVYLYRPYSSKGPVLLKVAAWHGTPTPTPNSSFLHHLHHLQDKFSNFQGAAVQVTAQPFEPYWLEGDGEGVTEDHGTDYLLLDAVASALNFTINLLPTANWDEVTQKVEQRKAFMATIIYAVLPERLKRYDFSYPYEYASPTFCMTKPVLKPQFLSLYYPLTNEVWLSILLSLILVPIILLKMITMMNQHSGGVQIPPVVEDVVRILLGQDMNNAQWKEVGTGAKLLLGAWLIFAFVIGTAYRGNLTAWLTIPKYPPRPETLEELVRVVKKVTMPPYGAQFRDFYSKSDSQVFKALAQRIDLVNTAEDGLRQVSDTRAHIEVRRNLELVMAKSFTLRDGSTRLYLGRDSVFPGLSAWPMPHDAPYKRAVDRCIMAVKEAGLYEKWSTDVMAETRKRSKRKNEEENYVEEEGQSSSDSPSQALSVTHLQGPLFLLFMGLLFAGFLFLGEVFLNSLLMGKGK